MLNFCTLFDSHYFIRGLTMYESLKKNCKNFHLYIFAFDNDTYNILKNLQLDFITVISLKEFEDPELLQVKPKRTIAEYCWTATPSVIKYVLEKYNTPNCIYIDADLYFFDDPNILIEEAKDNSVIITEHRFSPQYKYHEINGIYNVQFLYFKNDENSKTILQWWRDRCLEWCYSRNEDNKFGDQKYLDDWTTRFKGVHVLQNKGGGVAPWNVQQFTYYKKNDKIIQKEISTGEISQMIFYHFHNLIIYKDGYTKALGYPLSDGLIEYIYKEYMIKIKETITRYSSYNCINKGFNIFPPDKIEIEKILKRMSSGNYNGDNIIIYDEKLFKAYLDSFTFFKYISLIIKRIINKIKKVLTGQNIKKATP